MYAAGPEVEAIFDTLPDNGDDDDFDTACENLNEYFSPSKNVAFEVYKFRQARQQEHETLDAYYTRLCSQVLDSLYSVRWTDSSQVGKRRISPSRSVCGALYYNFIFDELVCIFVCFYCHMCPPAPFVSLSSDNITFPIYLKRTKIWLFG